MVCAHEKGFPPQIWMIITNINEEGNIPSQWQLAWPPTHNTPETISKAGEHL